MALKTVFLDAGGTLITERSSRTAMYAEAARERGLAVSDDAMHASMTRARRDLPREVDGAFRFSEAWFGAFIRRIFVEELGLDAAALPELSRELLDRFSDPAAFRAMPGSRELIDGLVRSGVFVGVLSNWSERLPELLDGLGLSRGLGAVVVSASVRLEKPDPAIFRLALERAGARPEEALHAGDDVELDVRGAEAVGMRAVLVDHADRRRDFPGERVTDLAALHARILLETP